MDGSVRIHDRSEFKLHTVGPKLDRYRCKAAGASLDDRKRKFAAREEGCPLTAQGGDVRLREDLQDLPVLKVLDRDTQIEARVVDKKIQRIGDRELCTPTAAARTTARIATGGGGGLDRELLRGGRCQGLATADEVYSEFVNLGAIDLDNTHLQLHLLNVFWADDKRVGDIF